LGIYDLRLSGFLGELAKPSRFNLKLTINGRRLLGIGNLRSAIVGVAVTEIIGFWNLDGYKESQT